MLKDLASIKVLFGATSALQGNIVQHRSGAARCVISTSINVKDPQEQEMVQEFQWERAGFLKMTTNHGKVVQKCEKASTEPFPQLKNAPHVQVDTKHRFPIKFSDPERRCQHSPGAHCCRAAQFAFIVFMRVVIGYIVS